MLLYIIRHGDPDYANDCLTAKGRIQAEALAVRFKDVKFDRIYSSPMGRARQTAEPTCRTHGMEYTVENWTSENEAWKDFSIPRADGKGNTWAFEAVSSETRLTDPAILAGKHWTEADYLKCVDAKAGYKRIVDASDEFLARQGYVREGSLYRAERPNDERIAVFCHEGFGSLWLSHLLSIPHHVLYSSLEITHTGVTILRFGGLGYSIEGEKIAPSCLCYSDISHIFACPELKNEYKNRVIL